MAEDDIENVAGEGVEAPGAAEDAVEGMEGGMEDEGSSTVIRDTDIVFDCPHCGHNLAIDYRGAGLPINCVNCGESVLVPIPSGMNIDDLDLEPGEILKQLFATRRNMRRAELRAEELEIRLAETVVRRDALQARFEAMSMQLAELKNFCLQQTATSARMMELVERIAEDASGSAEEDGAEETPSEESGQDE